MSTLRQQRGVAIITAVAIAAMVASLATAMAWRFDLWFRQVENQRDLAQARIVARAAVDLARLTLQDDARRAGSADHSGEPWAIPIPNLPVEQGTAGGKIADAQGLFNVNNLIRNGAVSEPDVAAFRRLLESLNLAPELAEALLDWMDADEETRFPGGAEDQYYLQLGYRAANQPLLDLSDLVRVKGFDAETIKRLQPFIVALPQATAVNINFAPPEVVAALTPGLSAESAKAVLGKGSRSYTTLATFSAQLPTAVGETVSVERLGVTSRYYYTDVDARFGRVSVAYRALVERNDQRVPRVVWMRRQ